MQAKVIAKAIIQNADGEVLLLRRSQTDMRRPGEWDFPGGNVDEGEDMTAAVAREIQEEAGLSVPIDDLRLLYAATEPYEADQASVTRLVFAAEVESTAVQLSFEHDEYCWVSIDTALEQFPHPVYGVGLRYARQHDLLTSKQ